MVSMNKKKRNILLSLCAIIIALCVCLGISYALWMRTYEQSDANLIQAGCFDVSFSEEGDAIELLDAFPMPDSDGMTLTPYTFTIKNECGGNAKYQINLEVMNTTTLGHDYIKVALDKQRTILSSNTPVDTTITNATDSYMLKTGVLNTGETRTFDLRIWVDKNATYAQSNAKRFESLIKIIASPTREVSNELLVLDYIGGMDGNAHYYDKVFSIADGYIMFEYDYDTDTVNLRKLDKRGNDVWVGGFAAGGNEWVNDLVEVADGFVVSGSSYVDNDNDDALIAKFDLSGNLVWKKTLGGTGSDYFNFIVADSDGFVVAGHSNSSDGDITNPKGSQDIIIAKYDLSGNLVWNKNFGGSGYEYINYFVKDADGYVFSGQSNSSNGDITDAKGGQDTILVKYDTSGNVVWNKNFGGSGDDQAEFFLVVSDGYVFSGQSNSSNGDITDAKGGRDAVIVKYDTSGNMVWNRNFGGLGDEHFYSLIEVSDGYLAVGYSSSIDNDLANKGEYDAVIAKYSKTGSLIWNKNFGGSRDESFMSITEVSDGYIVSGASNSNDGDISDSVGSTDVIIAKYDTLGNLVWNKNFGGTHTEEFRVLAKVSNGVVVGGSSDSCDGDIMVPCTMGEEGNSNVYFLAHYDLAGNLNDTFYFENVPIPMDIYYVLIDANMVILTGNSYAG